MTQKRACPSVICCAALVVLTLVVGCATRPVGEPPDRETAAAPADEGIIAGFAAELASRLDAGESAYWLVASSIDAFVSRLALFDSASVSLDIQYFIWQDDASGQLFFERLIAAADRGVAVRLLIDDISVVHQDPLYAALASHPRIEMRTFNPWRTRSRIVRGFEFLARAGTLNHRLHNKTIIADGHIAMLGGRNIGDRYFGVYDRFVQNDLDILFAGPVVDAAVANFDLFWNSSFAVPIEAFLRPRRADLTLAELRDALDARRVQDGDTLSPFPVGRTNWTSWFAAHAESHAAGRGEFIEDLPEVRETESHQVKLDLIEYLSAAQHELILSTAYLIPDETLLAVLVDVAGRGARVLLLTNSMQSNNHMLAHVAYKRSRRDLLRAGIELYELKPDGPLLEQYGVAPVEPEFMGLHSKAAVVDGRWVYVGTANIDPRSLDLNAESGVIADSPDLAMELRALLVEAANEQNAWRVVLDDQGGLEWTSESGTLERQPASGPMQRFMEFVYSLLPIKNQA